jgi:hypothetical protein
VKTYHKDWRWKDCADGGNDMIRVKNKKILHLLACALWRWIGKEIS